MATSKWTARTVPANSWVDGIDRHAHYAVRPLHEKKWLESGVAFGVKQNKVLSLNNTVEEAEAKTAAASEHRAER
jgi:hypothetical protein